MNPTSPLPFGDKTLVRISSIEVVIENIHNLGDYNDNSEKVENSRYILQLWWKKMNSLVKVRRKILSILESVRCCRGTLQLLNISSPNFDELQVDLKKELFLSSLSAVLEALPRDPTLGRRNIQARSVRTTCLSYLIYLFPSKILLLEDGAEDKCPEAIECHRAAQLLCLNFLKFLEILLLPKENISMYKFGNYFRSYRFSMRYFIEKLESWKKIDKIRMIKSLDLSYMDTYKIMYATQNTIQNQSENFISNENINELQHLLQMTQYRLSEISTVLQQLIVTDIDSHISNLQSQALRSFQSQLEATEIPNETSTSISTSPAVPIVIPISTNSNMSPSRSPSMTIPAISSSPINNSTKSTNIHILYYYNYIKNILNDREQKILFRLLDLSVINFEYLLHEITFNKSFNILSPTSTSTGSSTSNSASSSNSILHPMILQPMTTEEIDEMSRIVMIIATNPTVANKLLKKQMLRILGDRLICSLQTSTLTDVTELREGMIVPVFENPTATTTAAAVTDNDHTSPSPSTQSAKVLSIHGNMIDVQYINDNTKQNNIPISQIKLSNASMDATPLLEALSDLRTRISNLTPNRPDIALQLQNLIDVDFLKQIIHRKVISISDISQILLYLLEYLLNLQAPIRSEYTRLWMNEFRNKCTELGTLGSFEGFQAFIVYLPSFFEFCSDIIDEIVLDMANYYISTLSESLHIHGASILSQIFLDKVSSSSSSSQMQDNDRGVRIDATAYWLSCQIRLVAERESCVAELRDVGIIIDMNQNTVNITSTSTLNITVHEAIIARAILYLLRLPVRLDSIQAVNLIPETMNWHCSRLSQLRDEMDVIVLQTSMLLVVRQTLGANIAVTTDDAEELFYRLDVLLRDPDTFLPHLTSEITRFVRMKMESHHHNQSTQQPQSQSPSPSQSIERGGGGGGGEGQQHRHNNNSTGWELALEASVQSAVSEGHVVLSLLSKRVQKLLLLGILGLPYAHFLVSYSMSSKAQQKALGSLITMGRRIFLHNMQVYGQLYKSILEQIIHESSSSDNEITGAA
eukprot:gene2376-4612_t